MLRKEKWSFLDRMKVKLLPSLKEKKRYVKFSLESEAGSRITKKDVIESINKSCKEFMGEYSCGKAGVEVVENLVESGKGVVRVGSKYVDQVKGALMLINKINGKQVIFKNTKVSGVLGKTK